MIFWHYHLILKYIMTQIHMSVPDYNRNESVLISIELERFPLGARKGRISSQRIPCGKGTIA